jgi:putative endonuclease
MKGWMYILECANGAYYTGSTNNLELRLQQHQQGEGANFTKKHLPVKLVYYEEFQRVDEAFYREKQVQSWSRAKKEALINRLHGNLHQLAACKNDTHYANKVPFGFAQGTEDSSEPDKVPFGSAQGTDDRLLSEVEANSPQIRKIQNDRK